MDLLEIQKTGECRMGLREGEGRELVEMLENDPEKFEEWFDRIILLLLHEGPVQ